MSHIHGFLNDTFTIYPQMALEAKQGMSKLEQVCEEINEADRAKEERRALKKQKKKAKKKNRNSGVLQGNGVTTDCQVSSWVCSHKILSPGHKYTKEIVVARLICFPPWGKSAIFRKLRGKKEKGRM